MAFFIDLTAPLFPTDVVVFILCSSSIARALVSLYISPFPFHLTVLDHFKNFKMEFQVGVSGSATRAAVTQHQARMNNMADVSAKDGSQETLVNLIALVASLILLPIVSGKTM